MKSSLLTGLSLTLFMVLIVLGAAFIFLFQGRQTLEGRVETLTSQADDLQKDLDRVRSELTVAEATRDATMKTMATAESDTVLLEGQLVESQQQVDDLTAQAESLLGELATVNDSLSSLMEENELALQQPPQVEIIAPKDGAVFVPGNPVELIVVASDTVGLVSINLSVDGEPIDTFSAGDEPLFIVREAWEPAMAGSYTMSAMAANSNSLTSEPVEITIHVIDIEARNLSTVAQIEANVAELRGLTPLEQVDITFLTPVELRQQPVADFGIVFQPENSQRDTVTLSAFDFLKPDYDLFQAQTILQGVIGPAVHGPGMAEFIVVGEDGEINIEAQWAHVHEFAHVLQEQHHDLSQMFPDVTDMDARDAFYALVEGEAELLQSLYLDVGYFTGEQVTEMGLDDVPIANVQNDGLLSAFPPFLVKELTFPRTAGFQFVQELYRQGGDSFTLIDDAWENPPQSTEQILHPDRYLVGDAPQSVSLPEMGDALGDGWLLLNEGSLGEFRLREYLRQHLSEEQADRAAAGWGGDHFAIYWNEAEEALVMVLRLTWDSLGDRAQFAAIYPTYPTRLYNASGELQSDGGECWQGQDTICFYQVDDETIVMRSPDIETAAIIAQELELEN